MSDDTFAVWKLRQEAMAAGILDPQPATHADLWIDWNPSITPHVRGRFTARTFDVATKQPEPQRVEATCLKCGARMVIECSSGGVRTHIARFAAHHLHRDPLAAPKVERPGSLRRKP